MKRVWVAAPVGGSVWCGGIVERQTDKNAVAWKKFVGNAPVGGQMVEYVS